MRILLLLILCLSSLQRVSAQDSLKLNDAIDLALKNNFSALIADVNNRIAKNAYYPGAAGYLPTLDVLALNNNSITNTRQLLSNGSLIERSGAKGTSMNVSANLSWTVFNGFGRRIEYTRLKELTNISTLTYQRVTEEIIVAVVRSYYDVIRQAQLLRSADTAMNLAEQRMKLAKLRSEIGSGSEMDHYQARIDYNSRRSLRLIQETNLLNAKAALNELIGRNPMEGVSASEDYQIDSTISSEALMTGLTSNRELGLSRLNYSLSRLELRSWRSQLYPSLAVQSSYSFVRSKSDANFILSNRSLGFSYGFTASWTIFNGFTLDRNIRGAQLGLQVADLQLRQTELRLNTLAVQAHNNYNMQLQALNLERENIRLTEMSLKLSTEKYRQGTISLLQLKDAENSYVDAASRLANAIFNAKMAEVQLMQLTGRLVQ